MPAQARHDAFRDRLLIRLQVGLAKRSPTISNWPQALAISELSGDALLGRPTTEVDLTYPTLSTSRLPNTTAAVWICSNFDAWRESKSRSTCGMCQPRLLGDVPVQLCARLAQSSLGKRLALRTQALWDSPFLSSFGLAWHWQRLARIDLERQSSFKCIHCLRQGFLFVKVKSDGYRHVHKSHQNSVVIGGNATG